MAYFAGKLRELRTERGLTQMQLAEAADVTNVLISACEKGRRENPTIGSVIRLAIALGVDVGELFPHENKGLKWHGGEETPGYTNANGQYLCLRNMQFETLYYIHDTVPGDCFAVGWYAYSVDTGWYMVSAPDAWTKLPRDPEKVIAATQNRKRRKRLDHGRRKDDRTICSDAKPQSGGGG